MHSSSMCTVHCSGRLGGCLPGEVSAQRGLSVHCVSTHGGGVCLVGGGVACLPGGGGLSRGVYTSPLWTEFLTRACENITFRQLPLQTVIIALFFDF